MTDRITDLIISLRSALIATAGGGDSLAVDVGSRSGAGAGGGGDLPSLTVTRLHLQPEKMGVYLWGTGKTPLKDVPPNEADR